MEEESSSPETRPEANLPRQRQQNRADYNNWATQIRRPSQTNNTSNTTQRGRNGASNQTSSPPSPQPRRLSPLSRQRGLNGVRQLSNSLSNNVNVSDPDCETGSSSRPLEMNIQGSEVSSSTDNRLNPPAAASSRGRVRHRRRQTHHNNPGRGTRAEASNSTLAEAASPTRQSRTQTRRPLQGPRRMPGSRTSPGLNASSERAERDLNELDMLESPMMPASLVLPRERFISPILGGEGSEDNPFLLSPGSDSESPNFLRGLSGQGLSDEEIARQLQQEEWEAASSHGDDHLSPWPHHHRPVLRPIHRGGGRGRHPQWTTARLVPGLGLEGIHNLPLVRQELAPFIYELFHSYGIPDFEIQSVLNPDRQDDYESLLALADQIGEVNRGLSQTDINKLPTTKHTSEGEPVGAAASASSESVSTQCNICLTDYEAGDKKRNLPCKHDFHKDCVDQWLKTNGTCPVCRADVKSKFK